METKKSTISRVTRVIGCSEPGRRTGPRQRHVQAVVGQGQIGGRALEPRPAVGHPGLDLALGGVDPRAHLGPLVRGQLAQLPEQTRHRALLAEKARAHLGQGLERRRRLDGRPGLRQEGVEVRVGHPR